jgi:preprotein translocase subunit SecA
MQKFKKNNNIKNFYCILGKIKAYNYTNESNDGLKKIAKFLKKETNSFNNDEEILIRGFALVKEVIKRVLNLIPFDVQLLGALAIYYENVAQINNGEGKTLVGVFPAFINAIKGNSVHILTFNDYLAKRDANWMKPIYEFLGLSVGYITENTSTKQRKVEYNKDILYITAKEAGFDYLRDSVVYNLDEKIQRNLKYVIIDEIDSILIDEARIPLILALKKDKKYDKAIQISTIVNNLEYKRDYDTDENTRKVYLTDKGIKVIENSLGCGNLYSENNINLLITVNAALHAKVLLKKEKDYIIKNGIVEIIDEFTGRIADKRNWPDALQTAVEAKENITNNLSGVYLATTSLKDFVQKYHSISGMTGTAISSEDEFENIYDLQIIIIPPNKECIRIDEEEKINNLINDLSKVQMIK